MLARALVVTIAFTFSCTIRSATFRGAGDDLGPEEPPLAPCNVGHTGRLIGTVFAPNGTLPLPGVTVYVAGSDPGALPIGPSCTHCGVLPPGDPLTVTRTDATGRFTLDGVPVAPSAQARLVVQTGKWRRQLAIPAVAECGAADVDPGLTRLPRNRNEGDLPHIAMSTSNDGLECLPSYLGIDPAEITSGTASGAVHLYAEPATLATGQISSGPPLLPLTMLTANAALLGSYDLVMIGCDSVQSQMHTAGDAELLVDYAAAGGRLFLGHYQGTWIAAAPSWQGVATFDFAALPNLPPASLTLDTATPRGTALAAWLQAIGAAQGTTLVVPKPRLACTAVDPSLAVPLIRLDHAHNTSFATDGVQLFEFTTPVATAGCGRVMFSDIHVNPDGSNKAPYPAECTAPGTAGMISAAYALFELGTCT